MSVHRCGGGGSVQGFLFQGLGEGFGVVLDQDLWGWCMGCVNFRGCGVKVLHRLLPVFPEGCEIVNVLVVSSWVGDC